MTDKQQPEALRRADDLESEFAQGRISNHTGRKAATELRRLHAESEMRRAALLDEMRKAARLHAENETLRAGYAAAPTTQPAPGEQNESAYQRGYMDGMAKGRRDVKAAPQQEAQDPCPTCAALARTVMLDQVSFDRKPNCYGIRQITDDEGVEEWEDIRTSPDVAREEANYMMATGRGEIYEVVPLWTTPQPEPQQEAQEQFIQGAAWAAAQIKEWMAAPTFTNLFDGVQNRDATRVIADWPQHITELAEIAAPQPSPAAQGDALDAARLDWLIEQDNCVVFEGVNGFCLCWIDEHDPQQSEYQIGTFPTARAAIDAARAAQEDKSHDHI